MKGGPDDRVMVNPWLFEQQIVRCVSIDDITCHLRFQVPDLASEIDFTYWACTIGVEVVNGSLYCSIGG